MQNDGAGNFVEDDRITKSDIVTPFTIYKTNNNTNSVVSSDFKANHEFTNLHRDSYSSETPLQSPFTNEHVGGLSYRHTPINVINTTKTSADSESTRPEGWRIRLSSNTAKVYGPGADGPHKPRSSFYREEMVKRPVNIKNIKSVTSSFNGLRILGNYQHNYELVQTVGADVNNLWFVHHTGNLPSSGSDLKSIVFSDLQDFKVDERTTLRDLSTRQKTVINDRFSAPGGPEVNSLGFLDEASRTYSVYNNLNYRNLSVRQPLKTLLSEAEGKYIGSPGFNLRRAGTASFHDIHNNHMSLLKRPGSAVLTSSVYNNGFLITPIPSSDRQYSWITSSLNTHPIGDSAPLRYSHRSGEERKAKSGGYIYTPSIINVSSSEISSYIVGSNRTFGGYDQNKKPSGPLLPGSRLTADFVGLNYHLVSAVTASENFLSSSGFNTKFLSTNVAAGADVLNTWLLNHNGPYQYPSFKQIRTGEHPVARHMRRNNRIAIQKSARLFTDDQGNYYKEMRHPHFVSFTEPVVTSKYKPLQHRFLYKPDDLNSLEDSREGQGLKNEVKRDPNQLVADLITLEHTYGNKLASFSRSEIDRYVKVKTNIEDLPYDDLTAIYLYNGLTGDTTPVEKFVSLNYKERVWPREKNEYLSKIGRAHV